MKKLIVSIFTLSTIIACNAEPKKETTEKTVSADGVFTSETTKGNVETNIPIESTLVVTEETIITAPHLMEPDVEEENIEIETEVTQVNGNVVVENEKTTTEKSELNAKPEPSPLAYSPSHSAFDALLKKYVTSSGKVNYEGFKADKAKLEAYLSLLAKNAPSDKWTKNEKLAYWINLYNAATIQLILKNYPTKSIMDINGGKAWDIKFVKSGTQTLSLNQIENEIIRPKFKEPRIHFAVNCAAQSCPKLLNAAFYAHKLEQQLYTATKKFVNNSAKNSISASSVKISKIFEWYAVDFGGKSGLINYLNKYSNTKISSSAKVSFMEYNWSLNK